MGKVSFDLDEHIMPVHSFEFMLCYKDHTWGNGHYIYVNGSVPYDDALKLAYEFVEDNLSEAEDFVVNYSLYFYELISED